MNLSFPAPNNLEMNAKEHLRLFDISPENGSEAERSS
jgi:hypothetical protein